ncbi:energy transducer TonB [Brumimicrobium oceani]|uniref:TonB C-terminal domain-containing protein n=1 Tax=Brumimicrobium oceani TaxID=2100725 RepID=A0A2U2XAZ1_9FLAO|nr:energy transducer TonB [Brumimicrobium oceani]PWH84933.1 hypothetical protein DIT68_12380 [Brumimicrobium oceani]
MKAILSILLLIPMMVFSQLGLTEAKPEKSEGKIYEKVDKEANFPGGAVEMMNYIGENVKYPEISMENGDQGKVFVEFVVNTDGSLSQIKVLRGVSKEIDVEAVRVVKNMPKWIPAENEGEKVRSMARLPINFVLTD